MTTREVRAMLGLSQQRVSQLLRDGAIVGDRDPEGRVRYDRASVERLARQRAESHADSADERARRAAEQVAARARAARERRAREEAAREAVEAERRFRERVLKALETIAAKRCL